MSENNAIDSKEFEEAKVQAKTAAGGYTHTFKKPFVYMEKEHTSLHFDFESLTGRDMINIEKEIAITEGINVVVPVLSTPFLLAMAARACGLGVDVLQAMPISDANAIRTKARNFLLNSEL